MQRTVVLCVLLTMFIGVYATADLTLLGTSSYELRDFAGQPLPPPEDDAVAPESIPEMLQGAADLPWTRVWITEGKWRMDLFEQDPRAGASPVFSTIRLEEAGQTIQLDWQERTADISDDADLDAWGAQMEQRGEQEQADFDQNRVEMLRQIPPEVLEQMPPEVQEQIRQILAGEQEEAPMADLFGPRPTVTVNVEGPIGNETVAGLACSQYRVTTEVRDAEADGLWGHLREQTVVSLTGQLAPPATEESPWQWWGSAIVMGLPQEWEQATAGINVPEGFALKMHTVIEDLVAGKAGVLQGEILEYSEAAIAPDMFEIPAGFTQQQFELPEIGAEEPAQGAP